MDHLEREERRRQPVLQLLPHVPAWPSSAIAELWCCIPEARVASRFYRCSGQRVRGRGRIGLQTQRYCGIRVNDQFRICFRWTGSDAEDVEIVDYH